MTHILSGRSTGRPLFSLTFGMCFLNLCGRLTFPVEAAKAGTATATTAITAMRAVIERRMRLSLRSRRALAHPKHDLTALATPSSGRADSPHRPRVLAHPVGG